MNYPKIVMKQLQHFQSVSSVLENLKNYTSDSLLKPLLKWFIQDSIYQKFHSCRENTFTKVIKKKPKKKQIEFNFLHTTPDSSNIKDGCKTPGAKVGFSPGVCSLPQMFKSLNLTWLLLKWLLQPISPSCDSKRTSTLLCFLFYFMSVICDSELKGLRR